MQADIAQAQPRCMPLLVYLSKNALFLGEGFLWAERGGLSDGYPSPCLCESIRILSYSLANPGGFCIFGCFRG